MMPQPHNDIVSAKTKGWFSMYCRSNQSGYMFDINVVDECIFVINNQASVKKKNRIKKGEKK